MIDHGFHLLRPTGIHPAVTTLYLGKACWCSYDKACFPAAECVLDVKVNFRAALHLLQTQNQNCDRQASVGSRIKFGQDILL